MSDLVIVSETSPITNYEAVFLQKTLHDVSIFKISQESVSIESMLQLPSY